MSDITDRRVLKILARRAACRATGQCDRCKPHRGENRTRDSYRSWKLYHKGSRHDA